MKKMGLDEALDIIDTSLIGDYADELTNKAINIIFDYYINGNIDMYTDFNLNGVYDTIQRYNWFLDDITGRESEALSVILDDLGEILNRND